MSGLNRRAIQNELYPYKSDIFAEMYIEVQAMTELKKEKLYTRLEALQSFLDDSRVVQEFHDGCSLMRDVTPVEHAISELADIIKNIIADIEVTE